MLLEKMFSLALNLIVLIKIANYLGASEYGLFSYALSLISILAVGMHLGLSGIVVNEIVSNPAEENKILLTAYVLKFSVGLFIFCGVLFYLLFFTAADNESRGILLIFALILVIQPFEIIELYFQSKVRMKTYSIIRLIGVCAGSLLKIGVILDAGTSIQLASAHVIQVALICGMALLLIWFEKRRDLWSVDLVFGINMLKKSSYVFLGTALSIVYLKIDQVMLKHMAGNSEVGVYSVAVSFSEASYFIPIAIANSFFPKLIAEREQSELKYEESLLNLLRLLLGFSILLIGAVWLLSGPMIGLVMSEEFSSVEYLLKIHVLATLFIFLRALVSKWIILEGLYKFSAISQGGGALLNVILNLLLIPHYGATGAAWATVLSYGFASYFVFFFFKETRYIFDKLTQTYFLRKMIK